MNSCTMVESVGAPVCVVDCNHRIVDWNQSAGAFFRVSAQEALGREWHTVVHTVEGQGCCALCRTRRSLRTGKAAMPTDAILSISGYQERVMIVPVPGADDSIGFVILTARHLNGSAAPTPINARVRHLADDRIIDELTAREREVLRWVVEGLDARTIASKAGITHATARNYVQRILSKLGVRNKAEAVSVALTYNLLAS